MFRSSRWPEGIGITSSSERPRMQASRPTATESIRRLLQDSVACCAVWPATIAIPPVLFGKVVEESAKSGCSRGARVIIEKPFGRDLASAQELNRTLHSVFPE